MRLTPLALAKCERQRTPAPVTERSCSLARKAAFGATPFRVQTQQKAAVRDHAAMNNGDPSEYDRRITSGAIGAFGSYLMSTAYDVAIRDTNRVLSGHGRDARGRALHKRLKRLSDDEMAAARELARRRAVSALHGLLHGLSHDEERIQLIFDGEDVARSSDGLHGDLFTWMRDLSEFPFDWENE
jgi:hypothetical protein